MTFTTKNIVTPEGKNKKQVYKIVWMESETGDMVNVKVWDWEFDKAEVEKQRENALEMVTQANNYLAEIEEKLTYFAN